MDPPRDLVSNLNEPGDVPRCLTSFIGRAADLAALGAAVAGGARLITVVGTAGIGKTRLTQQFAVEARARWGLATTFCDLTMVRREDALIEVLARTLRLPPQSVVGALAARGRCIVIFDNFEQLLPAAASLVAGWSAAAPQATMLVTSREALRVDRELVYELAPLPEAVELFFDRARLVRSVPTPGPVESRIAAEIVDRLDRIPLAIELAAARLRVLSPAEILQRLSRRFEVLAPCPRGTRHLTMRDAIAWSWDLLNVPEQRALAWASVFRGGFTLEAATSVLGPSQEQGAPPVPQVMQSLGEKSLLRFDPGAARFDMYESIREFAAEKLRASGAAEAAADGHARYFLELSRDIFDVPELPDDEPLRADARNLEAILEGWADGSPEQGEAAVRAAIALDPITGGDGLVPTQLALLERALASAGEQVSPAVLARAALARAKALDIQGPTAPAADLVRATVAQIAPLGAPRLEALAHVIHSLVLHDRGRIAEALESARAALALYRDAGSVSGEIVAGLKEAACLVELNRRDEALTCYDRILRLTEQHGYRRATANAEMMLGACRLTRGDLDAAAVHLERGLACARASGARVIVVMAAGYLGLLAVERGDDAAALDHLAVATTEARRTGNTRLEGCFLGVTALARAMMDDIPAAERALEAALELLSEHPFWRALCQVFAGHLDLARSRGAARAGDTAAARRHRAAARARAEAARTRDVSGRALVDDSDDVRHALRLLDQDLARTAAEDEASLPCEEMLVVPPDADWFVLGDRPQVDLSRARLLRKIVALLCARRAEAPGEPLAAESLAAALWPKDDPSGGAAKNRLYVALAALRAKGLDDAIEHRDGGYQIRTGVRVTRPSPG